MASSLTFGVELEFVLGFHRSLLQNELNKLPEASRPVIVESPGNVKRKSTQTTHYHKRNYRAWALRSRHNTEPAPCEIALLDADRGNEQIQERAYLAEPLQIAQTLLKASSKLANTAIYTDIGKKQTDFSQWTVVRDASIDSLQRLDLCKIFDNNTRQDVKTDWDSYGIELVSKVYQEPCQAHEDVEAAISTLSGSLSSCHGMAVNDQTGFHVHVGAPDGQPFPLPVLQHLAYLVTVYEHELDRLHPLIRRSTEYNDEIMTNRETFFLEGADPVMNASFQWVTPTYKPLAEIADRLFGRLEGKGSSKDPRSTLVSAMGLSKQHLVNFTYSSRSQEQGPATVEFRQHAGTLRAEDVGHWVEHCLALVRLAQRYTATGQQCPVQCWEDEITLEGLWEEMGLAEGTRAFYRTRVVEYEKRWPDWSPALLWFEEDGPIECPDESPAMVDSPFQA